MDYRRLIIGLCFLGWMACSNERQACFETNARDVLRSGKYESPEYRGLIIRTIENSSETPTYSFAFRNDKNELVIRAESEMYCGYLILIVENEDENSKKLQNNSGYAGSVLQGLEFSNNNGILKYISLEAILD
jgi:hypothetical protein